MEPTGISARGARARRPGNIEHAAWHQRSARCSVSTPSRSNDAEWRTMSGTSALPSDFPLRRLLPSMTGNGNGLVRCVVFLLPFQAIPAQDILAQRIIVARFGG